MIKLGKTEFHGMQYTREDGSTEFVSSIPGEFKESIEEYFNNKLQIKQMNAVEIVTIKNKIPLFKKEEEANAIELIELEEVGYELVSQKNLYQIGDKAILIQPDYNVSDISLFESFIRPNGDESKSMLGKVGGLARRIRAKKFTLSKEPNGDPVYSNGILLPFSSVMEYLQCSNLYVLDLTEKLGIVKYEEPEHTNKWGVKTGAGRVFPEGVYKTDEENINNLWNHLEKNITYPVVLVGTEKVDGSSITIGTKQNEGFICSRNLQKPMTIKKPDGFRKATWWEYIKSWFGVIPDLKLYKEVENDDDFIKHGKPYLNELLANKFQYDVILRGELNGGSLKGSGNKNNPASKEQANIKFFGADKIVNGIAEKLPYIEFVGITNHLSIPPTAIQFNRVAEVFNREFSSKEDLLNECNAYFKQNMIEGIVVRTLDSKFSAKVMNLEYDSKK